MGTVLFALARYILFDMLEISHIFFDISETKHIEIHI